MFPIMLHEMWAVVGVDQTDREREKLLSLQKSFFTDAQLLLCWRAFLCVFRMALSLIFICQSNNDIIARFLFCVLKSHSAVCLGMRTQAWADQIIQQKCWSVDNKAKRNWEHNTKKATASPWKWARHEFCLVLLLFFSPPSTLLMVFGNNKDRW